jgi:crotonobetainyl-CoA:carnitine CoA-transferase CaiB-like acyl-CoA transferase
MKPLEGIRVIEVYGPDAALALRLAGSLTGRILADLGAQVSFGEPPEGDVLRRVPPFTAGGGSATFAFLSAGKHAIRLPDDPAQLIAAHDGAIIDAGGFARWCGQAALPAMAVLSMASHGAHASEFTVLALSGVLDIVGDPEREPLRLGGHQAAYSAGLSAFTGLLAALCLARAGAGAPRTVHVNLLDTLLWINWKSVIAGQVAANSPSRQGRAAEWQVLGCADGWLALVYQATDWPALCDLVGDPRLHEERFATVAARRENGRELAALIEAGLSHHTRDEIRSLALARRLPLGPVWSPAELLQDRHYLSRGVFFPAIMPEGAAGMMPSLPVVWNGARFAPGPVPALATVQHA